MGQLLRASNMNKYSEVNKEETLPENVSFAPFVEDRKTPMEISKRWITLTLCLVLSTIVGCVGLMIGFKCIERQEMEVLEEILKIVNKTKQDGFGMEFAGNETVEDLAQHPKDCPAQPTSSKGQQSH